jgi:hypothetical protein
MSNKLVSLWDWRFALLGTGVTGGLSCVSIALSILTAAVTLYLSVLKIIEWHEKRK